MTQHTTPTSTPTPRRTQIPDGNYHGKYNMKCLYIQIHPIANIMYCVNLGTCVCEKCSHRDDDSFNQPSIYDASGNIDITARRDAIKARMRATNTAQIIWDSRIGVD